jgi:hypothetical protein
LKDLDVLGELEQQALQILKGELFLDPAHGFSVGFVGGAL